MDPVDVDGDRSFAQCLNGGIGFGVQPKFECRSRMTTHPSQLGAKIFDQSRATRPRFLLAYLLSSFHCAPNSYEARIP
jgi:hypothetical protein